MYRRDRKAEPMIQAMEPRTHLSVSLGSTPTDLGDLTFVPISRTLVHANATGLPDAFTFTVEGNEKISLTTGPSPRATVSLRLENAAGQVAFNSNTRSITGVVSAGTYEAFATVFAGSAYNLIVQTSPSTGGQVLFPADAQPVPGGWKYSTALAVPLSIPAKVAATVTSEDFYSFTTPSYGRATVKLLSPDGTSLSTVFLDSAAATLVGSNGNAKQLTAAAGTYYLAIQDFSAVGLPIAFHFSLAFKAMKAPKAATTVAVTPISVTPSQPTTPPSTGSTGNASGSALTYDHNGYDVDLTPDTGGLTVKYTYYGDANVAGATDGSDYTLIDQYYSTQLSGRTNGDFNYDGAIDSSDYTLINNAFNSQKTTPSQPAAPAPASPVSLTDQELIAILTSAANGWTVQSASTGDTQRWTFVPYTSASLNGTGTYVNAGVSEPLKWNLWDGQLYLGYPDGETATLLPNATGTAYSGSSLPGDDYDVTLIQG